MRITRDDLGARSRFKRQFVSVMVLTSGLILGQLATGQAEGTTGAAGAKAPYQATNGLSGKVTIAGSETMRPLVTRLAAGFSRIHPTVQFTVEGGGSSAAIREFVMGLSQQRRSDKARSGHEGAGRVSMVASSRPLTAGEIKAFTAQHGYEPVAVPVALDAVVLYVNPANPIEALSLEQVAAIFGEADSKKGPKITTWGQVGLGGEWENRKIRLYGRDKKSGTREFFVQHVLRGRAIDPDTLEQPGSATAILAIARDPNAIGYAGAGFQTTMVRMVPLAPKAGAPSVVPTSELVQRGTYPLTRYLYLYVDRDPVEGFDEILKEFLTFTNSATGQTIVTKAGVYPLPDKQLARNAALLRGETSTALGGGEQEDPRLAAATEEAVVVAHEGDTPKED